MASTSNLHTRVLSTLTCMRVVQMIIRPQTAHRHTNLQYTPHAYTQAVDLILYCRAALPYKRGFHWKHMSRVCICAWCAASSLCTCYASEYISGLGWKPCWHFHSISGALYGARPHIYLYIHKSGLQFTFKSCPVVLTTWLWDVFKTGLQKKVASGEVDRIKVLHRSDVTDMHDSGQSITTKRVTDLLVARFCSQSHSASSVSAYYLPWYFEYAGS